MVRINNDDDYVRFEGGGDSKKDKYAEEMNNVSVKHDGMLPPKDRWATDIHCLVIFWVAIGFMVYLGVDGY